MYSASDSSSGQAAGTAALRTATHHSGDGGANLPPTVSTEAKSATRIDAAASNSALASAAGAGQQRIQYDKLFFPTTSAVHGPSSSKKRRNDDVGLLSVAAKGDGETLLPTLGDTHRSVPSTRAVAAEGGVVTGSKGNMRGGNGENTMTMMMNQKTKETSPSLPIIVRTHRDDREQHEGLFAATAPPPAATAAGDSAASLLAVPASLFIHAQRRPTQTYRQDEEQQQKQQHFRSPPHHLDGDLAYPLAFYHHSDNIVPSSASSSPPLLPLPIHHTQSDEYYAPLTNDNVVGIRGGDSDRVIGTYTTAGATAAGTACNPPLPDLVHQLGSSSTVGGEGRFMINGSTTTSFSSVSAVSSAGGHSHSNKNKHQQQGEPFNATNSTTAASTTTQRQQQYARQRGGGNVGEGRGRGRGLRGELLRRPQPPTSYEPSPLRGDLLPRPPPSQSSAAAAANDFSSHSKLLSGMLGGQKEEGVMAAGGGIGLGGYNNYLANQKLNNAEGIGGNSTHGDRANNSVANSMMMYVLKRRPASQGCVGMSSSYSTFPAHTSNSKQEGRGGGRRFGSASATTNTAGVQPSAAFPTSQFTSTAPLYNEKKREAAPLQPPPPSHAVSSATESLIRADAERTMASLKKRLAQYNTFREVLEEANAAAERAKKSAAAAGTGGRTAAVVVAAAGGRSGGERSPIHAPRPPAGNNNNQRRQVGEGAVGLNAQTTSSSSSQHNHEKTSADGNLSQKEQTSITPGIVSNADVIAAVATVPTHELVGNRPSAANTNNKKNLNTNTNTMHSGRSAGLGNHHQSDPYMIRRMSEEGAASSPYSSNAFRGGYGYGSQNTNDGDSDDDDDELADLTGVRTVDSSSIHFTDKSLVTNLLLKFNAEEKKKREEAVARAKLLKRKQREEMLINRKKRLEGLNNNNDGNNNNASTTHYDNPLFNDENDFDDDGADDDDTNEDFLNASASPNRVFRLPPSRGTSAGAPLNRRPHTLHQQSQRDEVIPKYTLRAPPKNYSSFSSAEFFNPLLLRSSQQPLPIIPAAYEERHYDDNETISAARMVAALSLEAEAEQRANRSQHQYSRFSAEEGGVTNNNNSNTTNGLPSAPSSSSSLLYLSGESAYLVHDPPFMLWLSENMSRATPEAIRGEARRRHNEILEKQKAERARYLRSWREEMGKAIVGESDAPSDYNTLEELGFRVLYDNDHENAKTANAIATNSNVGGTTTAGASTSSRPHPSSSAASASASPNPNVLNQLSQHRQAGRFLLTDLMRPHFPLNDEKNSSDGGGEERDHGDHYFHGDDDDWGATRSQPPAPPPRSKYVATPSATTVPESRPPPPHHRQQHNKKDIDDSSNNSCGVAQRVPTPPPPPRPNSLDNHEAPHHQRMRHGGQQRAVDEEIRSGGGTGKKKKPSSHAFAAANTSTADPLLDSEAQCHQQQHDHVHNDTDSLPTASNNNMTFFTIQEQERAQQLAWSVYASGFASSAAAVAVGSGASVEEEDQRHTQQPNEASKSSGANAARGENGGMRGSNEDSHVSSTTKPSTKGEDISTASHSGNTLANITRAAAAAKLLASPPVPPPPLTVSVGGIGLFDSNEKTTGLQELKKTKKQRQSARTTAKKSPPATARRKAERETYRKPISSSVRSASASSSTLAFSSYSRSSSAESGKSSSSSPSELTDERRIVLLNKNDPEERRALRSWINGGWVLHCHRHEEAALKIQKLIRCFIAKKRVAQARFKRQELARLRLIEEEKNQVMWSEMLEAHRAREASIATAKKSAAAAAAISSASSGGGIFTFDSDEQRKLKHYYEKTLIAKVQRMRKARERREKDKFEIETYAATRIQTVFRGYLARRAIDYQRYPEILAAKILAKQNKCATKIQRVYRGFAVRTKLLRKRKAVIAIQCAFRQHLARKALNALREANTARETVAIQDFAVRILQRAYRNYRWRSYVGKLVDGGVLDLCPRVGRGYFARRLMSRLLEKKRKADLVLIQRFARGRQSALYARQKQSELEAAIVIQAVVRGHQCRQRGRAAILAEEEERQKAISEAVRTEAAVRIQSTWRGYKYRLAHPRRRKTHYFESLVVTATPTANNKKKGTSQQQTQTDLQLISSSALQESLLEAIADNNAKSPSDLQYEAEEAAQRQALIENESAALIQREARRFLAKKALARRREEIEAELAEGVRRDAAAILHRFYKVYIRQRKLREAAMAAARVIQRALQVSVALRKTSEKIVERHGSLCSNASSSSLALFSRSRSMRRSMSNLSRSERSNTHSTNNNKGAGSTSNTATTFTTTVGAAPAPASNESATIQNEAAVIIQKCVRSFLARLWFRASMEARNSDNDTIVVNEAASAIQKCYRRSRRSRASSLHLQQLKKERLVLEKEETLVRKSFEDTLFRAIQWPQQQQTQQQQQQPKEQKEEFSNNQVSSLSSPTNTTSLTLSIEDVHVVAQRLSRERMRILSDFINGKLKILVRDEAYFRGSSSDDQEVQNLTRDEKASSMTSKNADDAETTLKKKQVEGGAHNPTNLSPSRPRELFSPTNIIFLEEDARIRLRHAAAEDARRLGSSLKDKRIAEAKQAIEKQEEEARAAEERRRSAEMEERWRTIASELCNLETAERAKNIFEKETNLFNAIMSEARTTLVSQKEKETAASELDAYLAKRQRDKFRDEDAAATALSLRKEISGLIAGVFDSEVSSFVEKVSQKMEVEMEDRKKQITTKEGPEGATRASFAAVEGGSSVPIRTNHNKRESIISFLVSPSSGDQHKASNDGEQEHNTADTGGGRLNTTLSSHNVSVSAVASSTAASPPSPSRHHHARNRRRSSMGAGTLGTDDITEVTTDPTVSHQSFANGLGGDDLDGDDSVLPSPSPPRRGRRRVSASTVTAGDVEGEDDEKDRVVGSGDQDQNLLNKSSDGGEQPTAVNNMITAIQIGDLHQDEETIDGNGEEDDDDIETGSSITGTASAATSRRASHHRAHSSHQSSNALNTAATGGDISSKNDDAGASTAVGGGSFHRRLQGTTTVTTATSRSDLRKGGVPRGISFPEEVVVLLEEGVAARPTTTAATTTSQANDLLQEAEDQTGNQKDNTTSTTSTNNNNNTTMHTANNNDNDVIGSPFSSPPLHLLGEEDAAGAATSEAGGGGGADKSSGGSSGAVVGVGGLLELRPILTANPSTSGGAVAQGRLDLLQSSSNTEKEGEASSPFFNMLRSEDTNAATIPYGQAPLSVTVASAGPTPPPTTSSSQPEKENELDNEADDTHKDNISIVGGGLAGGGGEGGGLTLFGDMLASSSNSTATNQQVSSRQKSPAHSDMRSAIGGGGATAQSLLAGVHGSQLGQAAFGAYGFSNSHNRNNYPSSSSALAGGGEAGVSPMLMASMGSLANTNTDASSEAAWIGIGGSVTGATQSRSKQAGDCVDGSTVAAERRRVRPLEDITINVAEPPHFPMRTVGANSSKSGAANTKVKDAEDGEGEEDLSTFPTETTISTAISPAITTVSSSSVQSPQAQASAGGGAATNNENRAAIPNAAKEDTKPTPKSNNGDNDSNAPPPPTALKKDDDDDVSIVKETPAAAPQKETRPDDDSSEIIFDDDDDDLLGDIDLGSTDEDEL